jgi:hypothetical protein
MPSLFWFLFQRFLAGLLVFPLLDVFSLCHTVAEVWDTFRTLNTLLQIGVITIVLTLVFVVGEVAFLLGRAIAYQWRNWRQNEHSGFSNKQPPSSSVSEPSFTKHPGRSPLPRRVKQPPKKPKRKQGVSS